MTFERSVSGIISYVVFCFRRLATSATRFLVVFDHSKSVKYVTLLHIIVTYIKENIIIKIQKLYSSSRNPGNIYLFKFNSRNIKTRYEICSKLTIKTTTMPTKLFDLYCQLLT